MQCSAIGLVHISIVHIIQNSGVQQKEFLVYLLEKDNHLFRIDPEEYLGMNHRFCQILVISN
jgi:hypothetical protein